MGESYQQEVNTESGTRHNLNDAVKKTIEIEQSECTASKIQRFIGNYLKKIETILQFVRATRQQDQQAHMQSLKELVKYFFADDNLNYACLLPLYISTTQQTEKEHPEIWAEFMKANSSVTKGAAEFTSIPPDHRIEKETRELKVLAGIVEIT